MSRNPLRQQLQKQQTAYGIWVTLESPTVTEIAVLLGLDWVCVDMEHGHLGYGDAMAHVRTLRGTTTAALVRVPQIDVSSVKRALDIGADGVLLPLVRTANDVEQGMQFGRYPPRGIRGLGGERAVRWGLGLQEYIREANTETLIIPIIETREAAENIDAILGVPGLEAIWFGPADLSSSYGSLGQWEGPGIAETILEIRARAAARGIGSGIVSRSPDDTVARRDQGFAMVGLGSDTSLLIRAVKEARERL